ncbi:hypothetical protein POWCR01_000043500 [Plasmodium ovale]|uniref:Uncharacterized protein n=1 Tax=Plasmodium ovale TaxID=36330 RepID=A0A1C3KG67_PLAOA|nr:hypothetical protein POWCR01_000043500 [Plasmodium ovale]
MQRNEAELIGSASEDTPLSFPGHGQHLNSAVEPGSLSFKLQESGGHLNQGNQLSHGMPILLQLDIWLNTRIRGKHRIINYFKENDTEGFFENSENNRYHISFHFASY